MPSITDIENNIVDDFQLFDDWEGKYEYIISLGKDLPLINNQFKTDEYLVRGCQSKVWLHASEKEGRVYYEADSDSVMTKGIIALLVRIFSGQKPDDIVKADLGFIDKIGLREQLSPTRSNGLNSMVKQIKLYALALTNKA